ncbi:unannotated protein [freshwater metagenome]|uniref:Unannotated protein n=3 Tax=freshwater metagenome TaxID=449393 RepID=A0A6J7G0J0_9ZZZZ
MSEDELLVNYAFPLDNFQRAAIAELHAGHSVLVAAPTGSGKTVVAEHALAEALRCGERAFYTTPIKALSNQKFRDLCQRHGAERVGLLTGDNSINGDAPIVVMTTEVLRNMIYAKASALDDLRYVVLDEVHYLEDAYRGPVWEEVIVHLPKRVRLVCLSATVSNAPELAEWITAVRGPTTVIVEHTRPVELVNLYCAADRSSDRLHLIPTLLDGRPNPEGHRFDADNHKRRDTRGRSRRMFSAPSRVDVVDRLREERFLPVIYFIFSRAACDDAMRLCVDAGIRLTTADERTRIREIVDARTASLSESDLTVLGYDQWLLGLEQGIAAHHAGMVPPFKETVEHLFTEGLVKVVFATETLALGINMPARTVVIEKLTKFTGDTHEFLTSGQYTQFTGRAGRRGIDTVGQAVVLWSPFVTFQQVADLASSKSFVLRSSFRPTYNMTANLVRRYPRDEAHRMLNLSFAQFQTDGAVVRMELRLQRRQRELVELNDTLTSLGAPRAHVESLREAQQLARGDTNRSHSVEAMLSRLKPGDVIALAGERAVVLSVAYRRAGSVRVRLVDQDAGLITIGSTDIEEAPVVIATVELPMPFTPNNATFQRDVADQLRRLRARKVAAREPREQITRPRDNRGPHGKQFQILDQIERTEREIADITNRVRSQSESLAKRFDDILWLLSQWGYVNDWHLTDRGQQLVRIFHECDLLIAEALARGIFDGLDPASLAGLASCFTYEHRSPNPPNPPWFPSQVLRERVEQLTALADELNALEGARRIPPSRGVDPTFFALAHAWAAGNTLETVLDDEEVSGGDFVRNIRQLVDLLRQIGQASTEPATAESARRAADAIQRGVVLASSVVDASADKAPGNDPTQPAPAP